MELKDLQLGDVVQVIVITHGTLRANSPAGSPAGTIGQATVIGLDPTSFNLQIMIGWNGTEAPFRLGKDNSAIHRAIYADNVLTFENSYWIDRKAIVSKVTSGQLSSAAASELLCRQCGKRNDTTAPKCWWCELPNPTRTP